LSASLEKKSDTNRLLQSFDYACGCFDYLYNDNLNVYLPVVTDRVFNEEESTTDIFQELISPIIESGMNGINGECIM